MAGRRRTIDRKAQRTDPEEQTEKAEEEEEAEDEDEEEDEEEEGDGEGEAEPAEDSEEEDDGGGDDDDEDAPKKKKKKVKVKKAAPVKRARSTKKVVRQKAVWIIFDNSSKQVETFPFNQKTAAEKLLAEKSEDKKGLYLQMVKVPLDEK